MYFLSMCWCCARARYFQLLMAHGANIDSWTPDPVQLEYGMMCIVGVWKWLIIILLLAVLRLPNQMAQNALYGSVSLLDSEIPEVGDTVLRMSKLSVHAGAEAHWPRVGCKILLLQYKTGRDLSINGGKLKRGIRETGEMFFVFF